MTDKLSYHVTSGSRVSTVNKIIMKIDTDEVDNVDENDEEVD